MLFAIAMLSVLFVPHQDEVPIAVTVGDNVNILSQWQATLIEQLESQKLVGSDGRITKVKLKARLTVVQGGAAHRQLVDGLAIETTGEAQRAVENRGAAGIHNRAPDAGPVAGEIGMNNRACNGGQRNTVRCLGSTSRRGKGRSAGGRHERDGRIRRLQRDSRRQRRGLGRVDEGRRPCSFELNGGDGCRRNYERRRQQGLERDEDAARAIA